MKLEIWDLLFELTQQLRSALDTRLPPFESLEKRGALLPPPISAEALAALRSDICHQLETLKGRLRKLLTEREAALMLYPLVLHCDEMVMRRLPPEEQKVWPLLQAELFSIKNGGDAFYAFIDERCDKSDTPAIVFEVLYFCLSDGFVGRYGPHPAGIERYKALLADRLPQPATPPQQPAARQPPPSEHAPVRRHRTGMGPPRAWHLYAASALVLATVIGITILFTNIM